MSSSPTFPTCCTQYLSYSKVQNDVVLTTSRFGHECFCGNTLTNPPTAAPETECSYKCEGALSQNCGAAPRINLYKRSATVPTVAPVVPAYTSQGCYTDNILNRALKGAVNFDFSGSMTRDKCASICSGWEYFGVE